MGWRPGITRCVGGTLGRWNEGRASAGNGGLRGVESLPGNNAEKYVKIGSGSHRDRVRDHPPDPVHVPYEHSVRRPHPALSFPRNRKKNPPNGSQRNSSETGRSHRTSGARDGWRAVRRDRNPRSSEPEGNSRDTQAGARVHPIQDAMDFRQNPGFAPGQAVFLPPGSWPGSGLPVGASSRRRPRAVAPRAIYPACLETSYSSVFGGVTARDPARRAHPRRQRSHLSKFFRTNTFS